MEERLVNEEYKIWKKNTPFLYGASHEAPCMLWLSESCANEQLFIQPLVYMQISSSRTRWSGPASRCNGCR